MKDIIGTEIVVGSKVIFAKGGKHALHKGAVVQLSAKTVKIEHTVQSVHWDGEKYVSSGTAVQTYQRAPENVAVYLE